MDKGSGLGAILALSLLASVAGAAVPWATTYFPRGDVVHPQRFPANPGARRGLVIAEIAVSSASVIDEVVATHATDGDLVSPTLQALWTWTVSPYPRQEKRPQSVSRPEETAWTIGVAACFLPDGTSVAWEMPMGRVDRWMRERGTPPDPCELERDPAFATYARCEVLSRSPFSNHFYRFDDAAHLGYTRHTFLTALPAATPTEVERQASAFAAILAQAPDADLAARWLGDRLPTPETRSASMRLLGDATRPLSQRARAARAVRGDLSGSSLHALLAVATATGTERPLRLEALQRVSSNVDFASAEDDWMLFAFLATENDPEVHQWGLQTWRELVEARGVSAAVLEALAGAPRWPDRVRLAVQEGLSCGDQPELVRRLADVGEEPCIDYDLRAEARGLARILLDSMEQGY